MRLRPVAHQIALVLALAQMQPEFVGDLTAMLLALVLGQAQVRRVLLVMARLLLALLFQSLRRWVGSCYSTASQAWARWRRELQPHLPSAAGLSLWRPASAVAIFPKRVLQGSVGLVWPPGLAALSWFAS